MARAAQTIKAGGRYYGPGDVLPDLAPLELRRLAASGALAEASPTEPESAPPAGGGDPPPGDADPRVAAARALAAERAQQAHDPARWTSDGRPYVDLLAERAGVEVTAAERDAAWATVQGAEG